MSERARRAYGVRLATLVAFSLFVCTGLNAAESVRYDIGRSPNPDFVKAWDIAIGPEGEELPPGQGSVSEGATLYAERCAACHGASGHEGPDPILVGGQGSLDSESPLLTIGSYWAYATTLYDYIYRAMPFVAPGSLKPNEVYALCAYLLHANGIIGEDSILDARRLSAIRMPNHGRFIADPRPDIRPKNQL